jgi:hypothetical protein
MKLRLHQPDLFAVILAADLGIEALLGTKPGIQLSRKRVDEPESRVVQGLLVSLLGIA